MLVCLCMRFFLSLLVPSCNSSQQAFSSSNLCRVGGKNRGKQAIPQAAAQLRLSQVPPPDTSTLTQLDVILSSFSFLSSPLTQAFFSSIQPSLPSLIFSVSPSDTVARADIYAHFYLSFPPPQNRGFNDFGSLWKELSGEVAGGGERERWRTRQKDRENCLLEG